MKNKWNKNLWIKKLEKKNLIYKQIRKCNFFTKGSFISSILILIACITFFIQYKKNQDIFNIETIFKLVLFSISFIIWLLFIIKSGIFLKKINFKNWEIYFITEIILLCFGNLFLLTKLKMMLDEIENEEKIKQLNEIAKSKNIDIKNIPLENQMIEKA